MTCLAYRIENGTNSNELEWP